MSSGLEKIINHRYRFNKQERSTSCKDKFSTQNKQQRITKAKKKVILNIHKKVLHQEKVQNNHLLQRREKAAQQDKKQSYKELNLFKCFEKPNTLPLIHRVQFNQESDIKQLLVKICNNHNQMVRIIQNILLKRLIAEQRDSQMQKKKVQQENNRLQLQLYKVVSQLKKENSQTSTAYDEIASNLDSIICNKNKIRIKQISRSSNLCDQNSIIGSILSPEIVNKLLIQSIGIEKGDQEQKIRLRQLISRRFHAFSLNYNFFLSILIENPKKFISKHQFYKILKDIPFLLQEDQIQLIKNIIFQTKVQKSQYQTSNLAERMRYLVEDRPPFKKNIIKKQITQFKQIIKQNQSKILQSINQKSDQSEQISLNQLKKVLKEYTIQNYLVQFIISKLCVESKSIKELKFMKMFDEYWIEKISK